MSERKRRFDMYMSPEEMATSDEVTNAVLEGRAILAGILPRLPTNDEQDDRQTIWQCAEGLIKRIVERIDVFEHSGDDETSTQLRSDMLKMIRERIVEFHGLRQLEHYTCIAMYLEYRVEHNIADSVIAVIQKAIADPEFKGIRVDVADAVKTLREIRRQRMLAVCMGWHPRLGAHSALINLQIDCLARRIAHESPHFDMIPYPDKGPGDPISYYTYP